MERLFEWQVFYFAAVLFLLVSAFLWLGLVTAWYLAGMYDEGLCSFGMLCIEDGLA